MGQSLAIPRVIPEDWKRLDLIVNKIKMRLGRDASPTFAGLTVTNSCVLGSNSAVFQPATDSTTFFQVLDADGGTPIFNVDSTNERVGVNKADPEVRYHVVATATGAYPIYLDSINNTSPLPGIAGRSARGTLGSETATQSGDILAAFGGRGHNGTAFETTSSAFMLLVATENFTATDNGSKIDFYVTPTNSITSQLAVEISDAGNVGIGGGPGANYQLDIFSTAPILALENTTEEDGDGGSESLVLFRGEDSGGTARSQAYIRGEHDGTGTNGAGNLRFYTSTTGNSLTEALRIDSSQYVGINETAAVGRLSLTTSANSQGIYLRRHSGSSGDNIGLYFKASTDVTANYWKGAILWQDDGTAGARGSLHLCVDGVNDSGNAGIAEALITLTSGRLIGLNEVAPETFIELTSTAPVVTFHNSTPSNAANSRGCGMYFKGHQAGGTEGQHAAITAVHSGTGDNQAGKLTFYVTSSLGAPVDMMELRELSPSVSLNGDTYIDGAARIGDGLWTNYSEFESDGTLKFNGTATVWNDANLGVAQLALPTAAQPDEDEFVDEAGDDTGISTWAFAVGEKVSGSIEIPHDYKEGSDITFHVHWQGITAPTGTDNVKWQCTYTVAQAEATLDAVGTTVIETAYDTQYEFKISSCAAITGTNFNMGDQFLFTLERIAAVGDAYAGDALVATVGIHYECDTVGSRQILTK